MKIPPLPTETLKQEKKTKDQIKIKFIGEKEAERKSFSPIKPEVKDTAPTIKNLSFQKAPNKEVKKPKKIKKSVKQPPSPKTNISKKSTKNPNQETLTLKDLELKKSLPISNQKSRIKVSPRQKRIEQAKERQANQIQGQLLQEARSIPAAAEILSDKGFGLRFETPKGVPETELNSTEKIFYSFHKRTYLNYLNTFISTYLDFQLTKPTLRESLRDRHRLTARVTYDYEGNIVAIKILKSSLSDDVHQLFEQTLLRMKALPNPPQALIGDDGELRIYYRLNIN